MKIDRKLFRIAGETVGGDRVMVGPDERVSLAGVCRTVARLLGPCAVMVSLAWAPVRAEETLADAMSLAYLHNPALQAERAKLRSIEEQVPGALAGMRPTVSLSADAQRQRTTTSSSSSAGSAGSSSRTASVDLVQPIYKGGQIQAKISGAQNRVLAERATLMSTEQSTLLAAATAYMDVLRDHYNLSLISDYQNILIRQLNIEKRRLTIGESTRTDLSQAETRLAGAIADRIQMETTLRSSMSDYVRVIGKEPGKLVNPKVTMELPANIDEAIEAARTFSPDVISAKYSESSARNDVEAIDGQLLPEVNAVGSFSRTWEPGTSQGVFDSSTIMLKMKLPIDNGTTSAQARGARQTVSQMMLQIEDAQRRAVDTAVKSWNGVMAVRAQIRFREAAIQSIGVMLNNMRTEVNIGARSLTDLLNAEQESLSARQVLINAKHDEVILSFNLLAAIGRLTAQNIRLPVQYYDYEVHYNRVRNKIWGASLSKDHK